MRLILGFLILAKPLNELLQKDVEFNSDERCLNAFNRLKQALISTPIMQAHDWSLPFELMCDASDISVGAFLGQKKEGRHHVIFYISKTLDPAHRNYTTTKKEMLAVVYAFERLRQYVICSKVVFTDHSALKFLMTLRDAKPRLIRWVL